MYDYITIERQYACGGQQIATELSKRLQYRLYDHSVVVEACKRMDISYNILADMDEQAPVKTIFKPRGDKYLSLEDQIFRTEKEIILDAAKEPGCIFVGRCASGILNDKHCLKVFITASPEFRKDRAIKTEKISAKNAETVMKKFDKRREKYFSGYSNAKWGDPDYFDLVLNSGQLGVDACVAAIEAIVKC